ncbi:helix-turn-helix transcriptional regulator [Frankia sp. Ag45/Mut15]|uniref:Helix-turn-helix transcriptional regulator n=1 Tax=Frankia umida TaxID=573489 RepID=A0ABT0JS29_9ACTN|nr:helix-turn-helix transcriptional regulator [Frankia umida]MCK9874357.1 helix-turn-helix transcriptional regulator [Frankia umida]
MTSTVGDDRPRAAPRGGTAAGVGALLRQWRQQRRLSQLELALRADSSARHISFVETGKALPSRAMLLRLADHLEVPVRDRNALLLAAGYAPAFTETPLTDPAMAAVRAGLVEFLAACEPNPALVLHGPFDIVMTNRPTQALLTGVAPDLLRPPVNLMRLALHPRGLAPRIVNLPRWREHLLDTLRRSMIAGGPSALHGLYEEVSGYPVPVPVASPGPDSSSWREAGTRSNGTGPPAPPGSHSALALPLCLRVGDRVLTFLSTMTTFNAPTDVTVSELAIELFLPADATTTRTITELVARTDASTPGPQPRS